MLPNAGCQATPGAGNWQPRRPQPTNRAATPGTAGMPTLVLRLQTLHQCVGQQASTLGMQTASCSCRTRNSAWCLCEGQMGWAFTGNAHTSRSAKQHLSRKASLDTLRRKWAAKRVILQGKQAQAALAWQKHVECAMGCSMLCRTMEGHASLYSPRPLYENGRWRTSSVTALPV